MFEYSLSYIWKSSPQSSTCPVSHTLKQDNCVHNQVCTPAHEEIKVSVYCVLPHSEPCIQGDNVINMNTYSEHFSQAFVIVAEKSYSGHLTYGIKFENLERTFKKKDI